MSNEIKNKVVPKFRFPEFKDDEGWEKKEFSKLFEIGNGRDYKHLSKGEIPVFGSGGYMLSVDDYLYEGESVCIGRKGTIDKPMFLSGKFWTVDTLFYTHSFKGCLPKFIYSVFQNINWLYYNEAGGVPSLSKTTISKIEAFIPKLDEQQKIADCISSLDELISAQSQKLQALKAHKKGLMQQLFPAEGETVPKLRFAEFRNSGDWDAGEVADLVDTVMGNAFQSSDFVEEGVQLLRMGNLYQGELSLDRTPIFLPINFEEQYSRFLVKPLDLLMSMTGTAGKRDYGFIVQIPEDCTSLLLNQRVVKIVPKENGIKGFILQLLKSDNFLQQLFSRPGGTKQANLSVQQLVEITITFPKPKEQQKIADCLSSLDEQISAQAEKIEALKVHKKGLMQALFPSEL